jgi:hypothetical protein
MLSPAVACLATEYDLNDSRQVEATKSGGVGLGQDGVANRGRTNVKFEDFGWSADGFSPNSGDASRPADLLPINRQNTVTAADGSQLDINNYSAAQIKPNQYDGTTSGTSITQAPQLRPGQVNPYLPGSRTSLPPTSMGLQGTLMPNATLPLPGPTKKSRTSFGGIAPWSTYRGSYTQSQPTAAGFNPLFGGANSLPPASYGLVDFSTVSR